MKKLLLTTTAVFTILFTQAQCQAYFFYMQNGPTTVFTDSSTMQSTNYSATWFWDFGDNSAPSYQQNPTHTYSNGVYNACLTVTFLDSASMNSCTAVYCDSILIGNAPPASWDCNPATGCYDPGTGNGQYTSLSACQSACTVTSSWDCNPPNMPAGCYDPGTGNGQYTTLSACQSACAVATSWDCDPVNGCYDPGTGLGLYNTLASCQSNCSNTTSNYCDSMTASGSQSQIIMEVNNINIDYWVTTAPDMTMLGEDSMSTTHNVYNYNPMTSLPYDTMTTCITYTMNSPMTITCCVIWIWNGTYWAMMGNTTSIGEINYTNKRLIKIVDILGRKTFPKSNKTLFFIYDNGTVEKRIVIE